MADSGIKKVVIPNNALPLVSYNVDEIYYDIRYRIISEDKNRTSYWSDIKRIIMPPTSDADLPYTTTPRINIYTVTTGTGSKAITSTWTYPTAPADFNVNAYKAELERRFAQVGFFDIFVRWSDNLTGPVWTDWVYETTISTNTYNILARTTPTVAKRIEIGVQIPTALRAYEPRLELFNVVHTI
jgi:hypothetical protein